MRMAIIDSADGKTLTKYSIDELKEQAALMRGYSLTALCAAGSGHAGGTLSIMDVAAALYLRCAEHDPRNPEWKNARPHYLVGRAQSPCALHRPGILRLLR